MVSRAALLLLPAVLALTLLAYWQGLYGPFFFDDGPNITKNPAILLETITPEGLLAAATSYGRDMQRSLSMLTFAFNHLATGLDPFWFKLTNLGIHLANGILLFVLVRLWLTPLASRQPSNPRQIDPSWIALAVAAAWLLHPLNLSSVLYVVQRMTSLATLWTLVGMVLYSAGRLRMQAGRSGGFIRIWIGLGLGTSLALLSKETGVLLPLLLFVCEAVLFRFSAPARAQRLGLIATFIVFLGLPFAFGIIYLTQHPELIFGGYGGRPFTLEQRLLTQTRVLWLYLNLLLFPTVSAITLHHDEIALSTGWLTPWSTLPAAVGLATLLGLGLTMARRQPILAFGILFFLAGHTLESTALPLEIAHEHRNYLPGIGILLALFYYLLPLGLNARSLRVGRLLSVAVIAHFGLTTSLHASTWSNLLDLSLINVAHHPGSSRWNHEAGRALWIASTLTPEPSVKDTLRSQAREHLLQAYALSPYFGTGSLLALLHLQSLDEQPTDDHAVSSVRSVLKNGPVAPFVTTAMVDWLDCTTTKICRDTEALTELYREAFSSRVIPPRDRAKILAAAAQYALSRNDAATALAHAKLAVRLDASHLQHQLNLAYLYTYTGALGNAQEVLDHIAASDKYQQYERKRLHLQGQIDNLRNPIQPQRADAPPT